MANFVKDVDFTVNDKSTMDRFHVELTFAFDVSNYLENDGFRITIEDLLTHKNLLITSEDLLYGDGYGLVPIQGDEINEETKAKQINDSLIENEGLVIFLTGYNILTIIMIPKCTNGNKTIGFYSSNVYVQFTEEEEINSIKFFANLFPKMIRNETIVQNEEIDDPVLKEMNIRPAFDFNKNVDKNVNRSFKYDTKKIFYANTTSKEYIDEEVPAYISTISAMGIDDLDKAIFDFQYNWEKAESYLVDESTDKKYDIDYTVNEPDSYTFEPVPDYTTTVDDYLVTQYIYKETPGFYKNKLVFNLENIPTDTSLENLVVTIEDLNPKRFNSMDISGTGTVKIYNPNVDYRSLDILTSGFIEDLFENLDVEVDYEGIDTSRYETYGEVTIPLKNICFDLPEGTKKAVGKFGYSAYLDIQNIERLTPEEIRDITYGWDSVAIDYYTEAPKLIPLSAEIISASPNYADNTIMLNDPETISVKITNLNLDYISDDYPIAISCTWNGEDKVGSIINEDKSHYATDHYITFDVTGLEATETIDTYDFVVAGYIQGEDPDVEPPITEEQMKTETTGSTSMQFKLFIDRLESLIFDVDSIVYDPELHIDDEGDLVKQIKKNSTQTLTITLLNPNINYRDKNLYPVVVEKVTGIDHFDDISIEVTYDDNYAEMSDLGGKITVTVRNMHIDEPNVKKKLSIHAYINASDAHHTQEEIKTATETSYEDEDWWMMEDPVIPYIWEFMKNYVIYTDSVLETENSYIGARDIRCAGANFSFTNVESNIYAIGNLNINNHNRNPDLPYYLGDEQVNPGSTSTGQSPELNFYNNDTIRYNLTGENKPKLYYYYDPTDPDGNNRFTNTNISVIGNDPFDGSMILTDKMIREIPQLPVYPGTKIIDVPQNGTYTFDEQHLESDFDYDETLKIYKAKSFRAGNYCTINLCAGEFHFESFDADTYFTINVPRLTDGEYVKLMVQGDIKISNNLTIVNQNDRMDSLLFYSYEGDISFAAAGDSQGTDRQIGLAVAPKGTISLSNKFIWKGGTWAKKVIVQARSEYHLLPEVDDE